MNRKVWIAAAAGVIGLFVAGTQVSKPEETPSPPPAVHMVAPTPTPSPTPANDPASLKIKPEGSMAGYTRSKFHHWDLRSGSCDTRELVLRRAAKYFTGGPYCTVTAGLWVSTYDGVKVTDPSTIDIDHMVPLAEAWRSGAAAWSPARREAFANDMIRPQLRAVTATSNRSKGDQDPSEWLPPRTVAQCGYVQDWVTVKTYYSLTVDKAEAAAIARVLDRC